MFSQILHPADRNLIRTIKADKYFTKWHGFKDIKLNKRTPSKAVLFGYADKKKNPIYPSENVLKKNMLIYCYQEKKERDIMFLSKISIHSCIIILYTMEEKHFCPYCLQVFSQEEILKSQIKKCFKINGKQKIIMPKKRGYFKFKN